MSKQTKEQGTAWSPRSRASYEREQALLEQRGNLEKQVALAESRKKEEQARRARCLESISRGRSTHHDTLILDAANLELENLGRRLKTLSEALAAVNKEIEAECAAPRDRAGIQAQIAELARKRAVFDGSIEKLLEGLRSALVQRREMTAELEALAARIELEGDFDETRFAELQEAVSPVLPASERWLAHFLGQDGQGLVRAVARTRLQGAETLSHPGHCEPGQAVLLTQQEFDEVSPSYYTLKAGEPVFQGEQRKFFTPRMVVTAERFEEDKAAAAAAGVTVEEFWRGEDEREFQQAEEKRATESWRKKWDAEVEATARQSNWNLDKARQQVERLHGARP